MIRLSDEALLVLVQGLKDDVVHLRDNHLAHVQEDLDDIKERLTKVEMRLEPLDELASMIRQHFVKLSGLITAAVIAALGGSTML